MKDINNIIEKVGIENANQLSLSSLILLSKDNITPNDIFNQNNNSLAEEKVSTKEIEEQIEHYKQFVSLNIQKQLLSAKLNEIPFGTKEHTALNFKLNSIVSNLEMFDYSKFELINVSSQKEFLNLLDKVEDVNLKRYREEDFYKKEEIFQLLVENDNIQRDKVMELVKPKVEELLNDKFNEFSINDLIERVYKSLDKKQKNEKIDENYDLLDVAKDIYKYTVKQQLRTLKLG